MTWLRKTERKIQRDDPIKLDEEDLKAGLKHLKVDCTRSTVEPLVLTLLGLRESILLNQVVLVLCMMRYEIWACRVITPRGYTFYDWITQNSSLLPGICSLTSFYLRPMEHSGL